MSSGEERSAVLSTGDGSAGGELFEQPLAGGNSRSVVREDGTVRRVAGPWTEQVQSLIRGLLEPGVSVAPKPLGLDGQGREVVAFVKGDVIVDGLPPRSTGTTGCGAEGLGPGLRGLRPGEPQPAGARGRPWRNENLIRTAAEGHLAMYEGDVAWLRQQSG